MLWHCFRVWTDVGVNFNGKGAGRHSLWIRRLREILIARFDLVPRPTDGQLALSPDSANRVIAGRTHFAYAAISV